MTDLHGAEIRVLVLPYVIKRMGTSQAQDAVCLWDVDDKLLPLTAAQARKLAKALKRAAEELESR